LKSRRGARLPKAAALKESSQLTPTDFTPTPELLSLYNARYLESRGEDLERILAMRDDFAGDVPRVVELGSNRGAFLKGLALRSAEPVLGIEWREKNCRIALETFEQDGISNARVLHADAKLAIPLLFEPGGLDEVHVLFPDPWWKDRHAARRLLDPMFLRVLARRLAPDGALYLKSDVFDYLHRVRDAATVSEVMRPLPPERWPNEHNWSLSTRERKCMRGGIPFGRGYFTPSHGFDPVLPTEPERSEDFPMPDSVDAEAVIKGVPPVDKASQGRSRR
jgi:tRNA (guanine-N7-)-methyltransferase